MTGYSRDLFPHWITQSGSCDTRETVLKRDGVDVVTNSAAEWQPPRLEYHCMFAKHVVQVKYSWGMSMDVAEKSAINDMLATC